MTKQQRMTDRQKAFQAKYKMTMEKENEDNAKVNYSNELYVVYVPHKHTKHMPINIGWVERYTYSARTHIHTFT